MAIACHKVGKEPKQSLEDNKPRQSGEQVDVVARIVAKSGTDEGGGLPLAERNLHLISG